MRQNNRIGLAARYGFFAALSMVANLVTQAAISRLYAGPLELLVALVAGTGVGLMVKYVLDKRWIFAYRTESVAHDARLFVFYSVMGLATTVIFWGAEFGFDCLFGGEAMRYLGGTIGLLIGYLVKYRLDKAFVFKGT